jgi:60 kDa SS-A/Ro ribonucleoprotein
MAKFNTPAAGNTTKTVNKAGGEAYQESPKLEFVSLLLTSFVQDQYYRKESEQITRVKGLLNSIADKEFAAKALIFARNEFGMRSITHVGAGELAATVKGEEWTKRFFDKIVRRPDDMTEILAYIYAHYNKTEPNALKKGFAQALARFDEYQLGKWRRQDSTVSLVDVVNLVHPKPTEAITKLVKDELRITKTSKAKLSEAGREKDEEKADQLRSAAWREMLSERTIGYFDLLLNLRTMLDQAPDLVDTAVAMLTDEKLIRKSLVLPFRYLTAMNEIQQLNGQGVQKVLGALSKAVDISTQNVPKFDGETLVVLDESGSMGAGYGSSYGGGYNAKSPAVIGSLFAAVLCKANQCDLMTFSDDARYQSVNPADSTLTIANTIKFRSGGTNFQSIFTKANRAYDRIVILSDMHGWMGYHTPQAQFSGYKTRTGANPRIYSFDLQGYGTLQFPEKNVYAIAGFSEKVFDLMKLLEQDRQALVRKIEAVEL